MYEYCGECENDFDPCASSPTCTNFPEAICTGDGCTGAIFINNGEIVTDLCEVDPCTLEPETGPCEAAIRRYYRDGSKCKAFVYGGCQGNANNFESKRACKRACT